MRLVAGRGSIANALTPRDSCHLETLTLETLAPPRQCRALAQKTAPTCKLRRSNAAWETPTEGGFPGPGSWR